MPVSLENGSEMFPDYSGYDGNNIVVINDIRFKGNVPSIEGSTCILERICCDFICRLLLMLYILELIYQMNIVVRNIHIVLREQMPSESKCNTGNS